MTSNLADAWEGLHAALPSRWYVGCPSYHDERNEWVLYTFDRSERPVQGSGSGSGGRPLDRGGCASRDGALPDLAMTAAVESDLD